MAAENLSHEIDKLESELDGDVKGTKYQSKKGYIDILKRNLQNLPYTFNGDVLLAKKKKIFLASVICLLLFFGLIFTSSSFSTSYLIVYKSILFFLQKYFVNLFFIFK